MIRKSPSSSAQSSAQSNVQSIAVVVASQNRAAREAKRRGIDVKTCRKGHILMRAHYKTALAPKYSKKTLVAPTCVRDPLASKRRPGELSPGGETKGLLDAKGRRVVIKVEPGRFERHGYGLDKSERSRRVALRNAVEFEGEASWLHIFRRMILMSTWNKRKSPDRAARARADAEYLKGKFGGLLHEPGIMGLKDKP